MDNLDELRLVHSQIIAKLRHIKNVEIMSEYGANNFALSLMFTKKPITKELIEQLFPQYQCCEEDGHCPICMETCHNKQVRKMSCKHIYHKTCLDKWLIKYKKVNCPVCRLHFLI